MHGWASIDYGLQLACGQLDGHSRAFTKHRQHMFNYYNKIINILTGNNHILVCSEGLLWWNQTFQGIALGIITGC